MLEQQKPENEPQILSFEDFSSTHELGVPIYNNFYLYFAPESFAGEVYQGKEHFLRFAQENEEMAKLLCDKVQTEINRTHQAPKSYDRELYEAYKIMKKYGITDKDLFS